MSVKIFWICLLILCAPVLAAAQVPGNPENWCRNGAFPEDSDTFKLAQVTGARRARIYFLGDEDNCPQAGEKVCRQKAYLIPGNRVIVSRKFGNWMCAWYQPARGSETVGWLPAVNLSVTESNQAPALRQWLGRWKYYYQTLNISRDRRTGLLKVEGEAYWKGLNDNVHEGSVGASGKPEGNVLVLDEGDCKVTLKLVGPYIIATDNERCGGANVRFNGVYRSKG